MSSSALDGVKVSDDAVMAPAEEGSISVVETNASTARAVEQKSVCQHCLFELSKSVSHKNRAPATATNFFSSFATFADSMEKMFWRIISCMPC